MLKKVNTLLFFAILSNLGCTSLFNKDREPQSQELISGVEEFISGSQQILSDVNNPSVFNLNSCHAYIEKHTEVLFAVPTSFYLPKTAAEIEDFKRESPSLIRRLFEIRLALHKRLQEFHAQGPIAKPCLDSIREANQYLRFSEEYVVEWMVDQKLISGKPPVILAGASPHTMVNSAFQGFEIQTGDVFIIRGKSYVSAMIARIGDEEGNFSHLAVVGEDARGQKYVVESLIHKGLIVTPLEAWRKAEDARVAMYRFQDSDLAKKAGQAIYAHALKFINKNTTVKYDFSMNDSDPSMFFCSEVVQYAYRLASNGQVVLPQYKTTAQKFVGTQYFKDMGIKAGPLFSPSDIEVDPRFEFVAEYRFYPLLQQVRMQDAVLQSVYEWMIKEKYDFDPSVGLATKGLIAKLGRQLGLFEQQLPKHMPQNTLLTTLKYEVVATALEKNLYEAAKKYKVANGYAMSFRELMAENLRYRQTDCAVEKKSSEGFGGILKPIGLGDKSKFHSIFRPKPFICR